MSENKSTNFIHQIIDKDNEEAENIKKAIAENLKCDVSQVRRITKEEYMENNEEEE